MAKRIGNFNILYLQFTILLFLLFSAYARAQESSDSILSQEISIQFEQTPVYKALFELSSKVNHNFSYNSNLINGEKIVTMSFQELKLRSILDSLLSDTSLKYDVYSKHIIIYKKTYDKSSLLKEKSTEKKIVEISNQILDKENETPLPYSNVGLKNKSIGTITNENGEFALKIDSSSLNDTLVITFLGYNNKSIPLKEIQNEASPIYLEKKSFSIQEVIVRWTDPYSIVNESLSKIKNNYYQKPMILTSFYRESIKKKDEYTTISEAVMDIYKPHNKLFQSSQIKIQKSRKSINYGKKDEIFLKLKSGLEAVLLLDIIKENISFLNNIHIDKYKFEFSGITYYNDNATYIINFSPNDDDAELPLYKGKLYIDVKSLAIVESEFYLDDRNLDKISNSLVVKKKWDVKVKPKQVKYMVNYKQVNGKFYLNHIRGELHFKVREETKLIGDKYEVAFEMFTSNIDTTNVTSFDSNETAKPHKIFIEEINKYDPDFWGQYNYIIPEEPIRETVEKMSSQIKMLKK